MRRFNRDYNYDQRWSYYQKSNKRESYRRYNYNKNDQNNYDYVDYEESFGSKHRKNNYNNTPDLKSNKRKNYRGYDYNKYDQNYYDYEDYEDKGSFGLKYHKDNYNNTPDLHQRMIKKRKILEKEQEGMDVLHDYNFWEAHKFFKEVCESEDYPTLVWSIDEVDMKRLWKVDFGKFDQRKKFIDMFENYDGKGISNCIRIEFSYGGFRHDMFIEQPEKSREYSTDKFLFQNCITFNDEQDLDYVTNTSYLKPYLSKKDKNGILAKFIKYPEKIKDFAVNVLRIMKLSPKDILPIDAWNMDINRILTFEAFEIAGMILSTERLRSKKSLLLSCIEFYKLKHIPDSLSMLLNMFDKDEPIMKFPASPGGIEYIQNTHYYYIYKRFLDMIIYSPEYPIIQQCKKKDIKQRLMDEFYRGKLEKIRAVLENRQPKFKSGFKAAVKEIKTKANTISSYNPSSSNAKSDTILQNEISHKNTNSAVLTAENNSDEYFDTYSDNLSDTDYNTIFNNTFSSELSSSQQTEVVNIDDINKDLKDDQKIENIPDEYFDGYMDNLSDVDYDSILNNAIQSSSDRKN